MYATILTTPDVESAVNTYGWPGVAVPAGQGAKASPFTSVLYGADGVTPIDDIVAAAYAKASFWWLSMWTVSGGTSATATSYKDAAKTAAKDVAGPTVLAAANKYGFIPAYVVLDPEGYRAPGSGQKILAQAMIEGWIAGLQAVSLELTPAWYIPGESYFGATAWDANSVGVPLFQGTSYPPSIALPKGSNIVGYMAAYGTCSEAASDVKTVDGWGANMNTLQFPGQSYTCHA